LGRPVHHQVPFRPKTTCGGKFRDDLSILINKVFKGVELCRCWQRINTSHSCEWQVRGIFNKLPTRSATDNTRKLARVERVLVTGLATERVHHFGGYVPPDGYSTQANPACNNGNH
jgi:hypothetical protein